MQPTSANPQLNVTARWQTRNIKSVQGTISLLFEIFQIPYKAKNAAGKRLTCSCTFQPVNANKKSA